QDVPGARLHPVLDPVRDRVAPGARPDARLPPGPGDADDQRRPDRAACGAGLLVQRCVRLLRADLRRGREVLRVGRLAPGHGRADRPGCRPLMTDAKVRWEKKWGIETGDVPG